MKILLMLIFQSTDLWVWPQSVDMSTTIVWQLWFNEYNLYPIITKADCSCISSVDFPITEESHTIYPLLYYVRNLITMFENQSKKSHFTTLLRAKRATTHYSKSQIFVQKFNFDKPPTFSRDFHPNFSLTIFLVKSKLSTATKSKTTTFHEFFTQKNRQFSREIKVDFLDKKWRFGTVWLFWRQNSNIEFSF